LNLAAREAGHRTGISYYCVVAGQQGGGEAGNIVGGLVKKLSLRQAPADAYPQGHGMLTSAELVFEKFKLKGRRAGQQQYPQRTSGRNLHRHRLRSQNLPPTPRY
jgi:hypothetical protein